MFCFFEKITNSSSRSLTLEVIIIIIQEDELILKQLSTELCEEIRLLELKADPILKSYHLTLAYQFQPAHFTGKRKFFLKKLKIYLQLLTRLYSLSLSSDDQLKIYLQLQTKLYSLSLGLEELAEDISSTADQIIFYISRFGGAS